MWFLHRKLILFMRKPYLFNSVAFIHWGGNLKKEPIFKINVWLCYLLSPVRGKRRYFGCVDYKPNYIDIDQVSPSPRSSQSLVIVPQYSNCRWLIYYCQKLTLKIYFKPLIFVYLKRKNSLACGTTCYV